MFIAAQTVSHQYCRGWRWLWSCGCKYGRINLSSMFSIILTVTKFHIIIFVRLQMELVNEIQMWLWIILSIQKTYKWDPRRCIATEDQGCVCVFVWRRADQMVTGFFRSIYRFFHLDWDSVLFSRFPCIGCFPHGLADLHLSGASHRRGLLPGERAGGLGCVFDADFPSAYLLFCGISGRGRFPGGVGGSATGCAGGRVGGDPIPGLSGSQLCGVGADPSVCVVSFGYCCGPVPAGIHTSQVGNFGNIMLTVRTSKHIMPSHHVIITVVSRWFPSYKL